MALNIYLEKEDLPLGSDFVHDVVAEFLTVKLTGTSTERELIKSIEHGNWNDPYSFIDRFGYKLYKDQLSTGCKAALCVINRPEKIIDLIECGLNARDAIILNCKQGSVLMYFNGVTVEGLDEAIDVVVNGQHFYTVATLNNYLNKWR